jgi:restriction system protein
MGSDDTDYQTVTLPLLSLAADGEEHRLRDAIEELANHFDLTEDERKEPLPSGRQATFNRVGWARTYMKKAGLLESPRRGYFRITDQGIQALEQ